MAAPTEDQVRELGRKIYEELSALNAQPEVKAEGAGPTKRELRIAELQAAAAINAIALQGFARR